MELGVGTTRAGTPYVPRYLLFGVGLIAVYFFVSHDFAAAVLYDVIVVSGAAAIVIGVRRNQPRRPVLWYLCAAGTVCFALGDIVYDVYAFGFDRDPVPVPSGADAFYLIGYPFLVVAMWGFARRRLPSSKLDTMLDASVVALSAAIGVGGPLLSATADQSRSAAETTVTMLYPVAGVAVLAAASFLALRHGLRNQATQLLVASVVALFAGDIAFAYLGASNYDVGAAVDVTWLAHAVFLGAAALHPGMNDVSAPPPAATATMSAVRASIMGLALLPLAIAPIARGTFPGGHILGLGFRLALVGVVVSRWWRLSAEAQRAHEAAARRAASLAMAREEISHIVAGSTDAIIAGDNNGVITSWNAGAERLIGIPASTAVGRSIEQFVAEDITPWAEAFRNMLPGDVRRAVLPARRSDGAAVLVDVRLGLATSPDGTVMGFVAIARDASEGIVAPMATGEFDAAIILGNVRAVVGRVAEVGSVAMVAFDRQHRTYSEVLIGGGDPAGVAPLQAELTDDAVNRLRGLPTVFRSRDAHDVAPVQSFLARAGARHAVGVTVHHATLGPSGVLFMALQGEDPAAETLLETVRALAPSLTRVGRAIILSAAEETSARRTAEIDEMRADLSDFVRLDMREHVAAIRSALDVLADDKIALGDSWRERLLANLGSSVGTLERLVGDVATAGLVVDGRFPCELHPIEDPAALIRAAVARRQSAISQPIEVVGGHLPPIKGDGERLCQVLDQLLTNAAKYSPPTEPITVTFSHDSTVDRIRVAVRDRGIGIAAEDQPVVFRRFARLSRDVDGGRPEGTGLGLYIAQGIVESHGGRISVTSSLGEGSTFYVELPVDETDPRATPPMARRR